MRAQQSKPKDEPTRGEKLWKFKEQRIADGLCRDCGKPRGDSGSANRCAKCNATRREYQQRYRAIQAVKLAAGGLGGALGDTAPRIPKPLSVHPFSIGIGASNLSLHLDMSAASSPAPSVDPAQPWSVHHWRCVLTVRTAADKPRGRLAVTMSAGPDFEGQSPTLGQVLAVLLLDADDAGLAFEAWCAAVGLSPDSLRSKRNHRLAARRADALRRLLGKNLPAVHDKILGKRARR